MFNSPEKACKPGTVPLQDRREIPQGFVPDVLCLAPEHVSAARSPSHRRGRSLLGETFGRWTVVDEAEPHGEAYWLCRCVCGVERAVRGSALKKGATKSCGCLCAELTGDRFRHHGGRGSGNRRRKEYTAWINAKMRCENPHDAGWDNYGGRGITMAVEWRDDFAQFLADMGRCPSPKHTLERNEVNGPYAKWNCRWATYTEQARNRRNNIRLTHNGETLCLSAWAERLGVPDHRLIRRLRRGWPFEQASRA